MARTKSSCRRALRVPQVYGGWTVNRCGRRLTTNYVSDYLDPGNTNVIVLPSYFALDLAQSSSKKKANSDALPTAAADDTRNDNAFHHPSYLLELPAEILILIFGHLLPEGQVFHFAPTVKNRTSAISVHRVVPIDTDITCLSQDRLRFLPAVSLICRRLTDIAYTLFFRDNQFVFEVATVGLTSVVYQAQTDIPSYNKVIRAAPLGLAPLETMGAKHLTSLTISVTLTALVPTRDQGSQLQNFIQRIASSFEGSPHKLKSLTLDVEYAKRTHDRVLTHRLEVSLSHGLRMRIRDINSRSVKASKATEAQTARNMERLIRLVAPLTRLDVEDLQISGLLSAEDIRAYKEEILRDRKRVVERATVGPAAKRRRVS